MVEGMRTVSNTIASRPPATQFNQTIKRQKTCSAHHQRPEGGLEDMEYSQQYERVPHRRHESSRIPIVVQEVVILHMSHESSIRSVKQTVRSCPREL